MTFNSLGGYGRASCSAGSIWSMLAMIPSKRLSSQSPKSKGMLAFSANA